MIPEPLCAQVPWCEQEEGALGGQGYAQQEVGLQVGVLLVTVLAALHVNADLQRGYAATSMNWPLESSWTGMFARARILYILTYRIILFGVCV
jgi:hypothetical protein